MKIENTRKNMINRTSIYDISELIHFFFFFFKRTLKTVIKLGSLAHIQNIMKMLLLFVWLTFV